MIDISEKIKNTNFYDMNNKELLNVLGNINGLIMDLYTAQNKITEVLEKRGIKLNTEVLIEICENPFKIAQSID
ncbi:MAG: hypothetical protein MJZ20_03620 [Bacteroidaceae bacterium]|nr:hypothetical protein [Bacteroidaceae bacterium]